MNKLRIGLALSALLLVACSHQKGAPVASSPSANAGTAAPNKQDSLTVAQLSLVLSSIADGLLNPPECGVDAAQAMALLQPLHARWDEAIKETLNAAREKKTKIGREWRDCRATCSCAFYDSVLEVTTPAERDIRAAQRIHHVAATMKSPERKSCAERYKSLCAGELMRSLRAELE